MGTARARNLFVNVMGEVRVRYGFMLVGYVLPPEHVHLLVSEPKKGSPSKVVQVLKQRVSRAMKGADHPFTSVLKVFHSSFE